MPNRSRTALFAALSLTMVSGCLKDEETPFPAGLEPLEDNTAVFPEDGSETLNVVGGETDDWVFAHSRGYVHAPLADTWAAFRDPAVNTDRRRVSEYSTEPVDDADVDYSYVIHTTVHDIIDVDYDITWRHGLKDGTLELPESAAIRWQKTFGAAIIETLEGSIVLREGDDGITEVEIIQHLGAPGRESEEIEQFHLDMHADAVATVNGVALDELD